MNKPHSHTYSVKINKWIAGTLKLPTRGPATLKMCHEFFIFQVEVHKHVRESTFLSVHWFKKLLTSRLSRKCIVKWSLKIPQNLKCVATLSYHLSLTATSVSDSHLFSDINILQSSVATHLGLTASFIITILHIYCWIYQWKNLEKSVKNWQEFWLCVWCLPFLEHNVLLLTKQQPVYGHYTGQRALYGNCQLSLGHTVTICRPDRPRFKKLW